MSNSLSLPLLEAVGLAFPESSKTTHRSWIKEGRIAVNGAVMEKATDLVRPTDKIELLQRAKFVADGLKILFEDRHIIVLDKPAGLLSVSTAFQKEDTVHGLLKRHFHPKKVYVIHRLDQDTSGVFLFALSEEAYTELKKTFEKHEIDRKYVALVEGIVSEEEGTWESYLWEDARYYVHSSQDPNKGQKAITHYEVLNRYKKTTLLQVTLETGRKNQIRVHCQQAGHPIVGDKKYGASEIASKRLCLHAEKLGLKHPVTGKEMVFTSPIPDFLVKK